LSGDPEQEYFSDGLTDDLITDLSKLSGLFVIARNSVFTYKGKAVKVEDISKELGVRYVLEGSVRRADNRVRISAQLIDATTGYHLWSERYDRPLQDIFALQDEIVQKIVTTLKLQLTLQEQGILVRKTTDHLEAYDYYLRGIEYFVRLTKEANTQARQMFEKALALDPQYAEAYAHLSGTYWLDSFWNPEPQNLERAFALGQKAIALDDTLPAPHFWLGLAYQRKNQYEPAIAELERAIALAPNYAQGYAGLGVVLNFAGRSAEAVGWIEKAMRLDPRYPFWYAQHLGWAYGATGWYAEAIAAEKQSLLRNPDNQFAYASLARSYLDQWASQLSHDLQNLEQALTAARRAVAVNDSFSGAHLVLGYVYLSQQQYEQALAEMERAVALDPNEARSYAGLAEVLSRVGRSEEALRAAEQALRLKPLIADEHLQSVGIAYALAGRYEEALTPLKRFLSRYPNGLDAHVGLAGIYSELGREEEARAEAAEVLRLSPNFSLEIHRQRLPLKDPAVLERTLAALRKAGLK
jgi:TolB-like protein/Flp pilus assembly protein TadD